MAEATKPWYLRQSRRWQPFRDVPWKRLWVFCTAVFFLFSVIGFFNDLMQLGQVPYIIVLVLSAISGLNAVAWVAVTARLPWFWMIPLGILQYPLGSWMGHLAHWMGVTFALHSPTTAAGVRFAAGVTLGVVIASYVLFINFFGAEGRATLKIRNELALAHGIQKTLVPPVMLRTDRFEVYGISQPSEQVGGDLVDAVQLANGDIIAYVADIAGHGLSAGILMGMLKTAARTALLDAIEGPASASLPALLEKLNQVLPQVKEPQMYATLTAFRLNTDGSAWYAMAASPPVLHWRAHGAAPRLMQEEQYPLGLLPVSGFQGDSLDVGPGDLVVVATDGVLEVCNRNQDEFGIERVQKAIEAEAQEPLAQMAERILRDARGFGLQADDQTLLMIRRTK